MGGTRRAYSDGGLGLCTRRAAGIDAHGGRLRAEEHIHVEVSAGHAAVSRGGWDVHIRVLVEERLIERGELHQDRVRGHAIGDELAYRNAAGSEDDVADGLADGDGVPGDVLDPVEVGQQLVAVEVEERAVGGDAAVQVIEFHQPVVAVGRDREQRGVVDGRVVAVEVEAPAFDEDRIAQHALARRQRDLPALVGGGGCRSPRRLVRCRDPYPGGSCGRDISTLGQGLGQDRRVGAGAIPDAVGRVDCRGIGLVRRGEHLAGGEVDHDPAVRVRGHGRRHGNGLGR